MEYRYTVNILLTSHELDSLIRVHFLISLSNALLDRIVPILGVISELPFQFSRVNGLRPILIRRIQNPRLLLLPLRL